MSQRPVGTERAPVQAMLDRIREDASVTRRDYLRILVTISGGLLAGSAASASSDAVTTQPGRRSSSRRRSPGSRCVSVPEKRTPIAIRLADGALVAYSSVCTHLSCTVLWNGPAARIDCPCHDGRFDPLDGRVLAGPPPRRSRR